VWLHVNVVATALSWPPFTLFYKIQTDQEPVQVVATEKAVAYADTGEIVTAATAITNAKLNDSKM
jgi:hypothetical protein